MVPRLLHCPEPRASSALGFDVRGSEGGLELVFLFLGDKDTNTVYGCDRLKFCDAIRDNHSYAIKPFWGVDSFGILISFAPKRMAWDCMDSPSTVAEK